MLWAAVEVPGCHSLVEWGGAEKLGIQPAPVLIMVSEGIYGRHGQEDRGDGLREAKTLPRVCESAAASGLSTWGVGAYCSHPCLHYVSRP